MRFSLISLLSVAGLALAASEKVDVTMQFSKTNPFGRVQNGHSKNLLNVRVANHAGEQIELTSIHGQYREISGKQRALRNTTTLPLRQSILPGLASPLIRYQFHSENKVGEVGLRVWVNYLDAGKKPQSVLGYDGPVSVVEPPSSWFDIELLSLYAILIAVLYGVGSYAYSVYTAPVVPVKGAKRSPKKASAATAAAPTDGKTYEEEWIPEQVLRQRKAASGAGPKSGTTSGEDSEGGSKARKGKGKK
ncbi:hypothetical protein RQP46_011329 [Phenoliferia psychrophenolica]